MDVSTSFGMFLSGQIKLNKFFLHNGFWQHSAACMCLSDALGNTRNVPFLACRPIVHVSPFVVIEHKNFARRMLTIFTYTGAMLRCTRQETLQNFVRVCEHVNTCKYLC